MQHNVSTVNRLLNYLGQLRIYSLLDLALLLYIAGARGTVLVGALLLWLAFIAYLETSHAHEYRAKVPNGVWQVLVVAGVILYGRIEGLLFMAASYFYADKTKGNSGLYAPLFRGLQSLFLVGGLVGYATQLPWLALVLIFVRNAAGDFRDVEKDRRENMKTLPMMLGWRKNVPYLHLVFLLATSYVWWSLSDLGLEYLMLIWFAQLLTYNLTPR